MSFARGELYQYPGTRMVSTLAASAHFLTRPVMSSGLGWHQIPVATLDWAIDLKSAPGLIGPILVNGSETQNPGRLVIG